MTHPPEDKHDAEDERLSAAIEEYYRRLEQDPAFDRQAFLNDHAELTNELQEFFSTLDDVIQLAEPRPSQADPSTISLTQAMPTSAGSLLGTVRYFGDYELLEEIARGGMGVVYRARQESLGRIVAIKMILAGRLATEADVARFRQEATAAAQLQHPNVVTIFEIGEHQGQHFFSMEYVPGQNLAQLVRDNPLTAQVAAEHARTIAGAIGAIHAAGLLHRDLKPSNVLVDRRTKVLRVSDFGLAKNTDLDSLATTTGEVLGTPSYMSPEQAAGRNDEVGQASDLYSIGAVLYELITGRPPFKGETPWDTAWQVQHTDVVAPTALNHRVPRDLETICLKCLQKDIARRYRSAQELADDLSRFLRNEPIHARPVGPVERTWRWCLRNKGWAAFWSGLALSACVAIGSVISIQTLRASAARERAALAEQSERQQTRDARLQMAQRIRLSPHAAGWSAEAWKLVAEAAKIQPDFETRNHGAATLGGLDAVLLHEFDGFGTSGLQFDDRGERLLMAGWSNDPARLWSADQSGLTKLQHADHGPVAFAADGEPLQVIRADSTGELLLWEVNQQRERQRFARPGLLHANLAESALSPQAKRFACVARSWAAEPADDWQVAIWDSSSGQLLYTWPFAATALTFSTDGQWLAAGDQAGNVAVLDLESQEEIARLTTGRTEIQSLAFGWGPVSRTTSRETLPFSARQPLLACGASGGAITIWNLNTRTLAADCHGAQYEVHALQFSPDGTLLATCDRDRARLFDVTTGNSLLTFPNRTWMTSVAFSPNGERLAIGHLPLFGYRGGVDIWQLQHGRGIRRLRGLAGPIAFVCWSPSGKKIAAISHDWQVGVWDAEGGQLQAAINMPAGLVADNAAVAFDRTEQQLAYSTGSRAELWDLRDNKSLRTWKLPPGLVDQLAFDSEGRLWSMRCETVDRQTPPYGEFSPREFPRVVRIRDLLAEDAVERELPEFNWYVFKIALALNGETFAVEGITGVEDRKRIIRVFDTLTGQERWSKTTKLGGWAPQLIFDSGSQVLSFCVDDSPNLPIVDAANGAQLAVVTMPLRAIGPGGQMINRGLQGDLQKVDDVQPEVALAAESTPPTSLAQFDATGQYLAWGNDDGTVTIVDVQQVQRELKTIGLGW